ncbi:MAG: hypothetical protein U0556_03535 [Dehalococcoidia bacterium]
MLAGVDTYLIMTRDYTEAVRFHRDVLRLPIAFELPGATVFDAGALTISVTRAAEDAPPMLSFFVDDFGEAIARLAAFGVVLESAPDAIGEGAFIATVKAPGGVRYGLFRLPDDPA